MIHLCLNCTWNHSLSSASEIVLLSLETSNALFFSWKKMATRIKHSISQRRLARIEMYIHRYALTQSFTRKNWEKLLFRFHTFMTRNCLQKNIQTSEVRIQFSGRQETTSRAKNNTALEMQHSVLIHTPLHSSLTTDIHVPWKQGSWGPVNLFPSG